MDSYVDLPQIPRRQYDHAGESNRSQQSHARKNMAAFIWQYRRPGGGTGTAEH